MVNYVSLRSLTPTWNESLIKKSKEHLSLPLFPCQSKVGISLISCHQCKCELTAFGHWGHQAALCCQLPLALTTVIADFCPISSMAIYIIHTAQPKKGVMKHLFGRKIQPSDHLEEGDWRNKGGWGIHHLECNLNVLLN